MLFERKMREVGDGTMSWSGPSMKTDEVALEGNGGGGFLSGCFGGGPD